MLHPQMFLRLYRRLVWTFTVRVTSFERKKYVSLSHEPNKAMNLNSYIGLMGGHFREAAGARRHGAGGAPSPDRGRKHPRPGLRGDAGRRQRAAA